MAMRLDETARSAAWSTACLAWCAAGAVALASGVAGAQSERGGVPTTMLTVVNTYNPSPAGGLCGGSYSEGDRLVWTHDCFGSDIQAYEIDGTFVGSVAVPSSTANDVDVDIAPVDMMMAGSFVPRGSVLFINGESGPAEIYALDPSDGTLLATLNTAFGVSHIVGGAYHPTRGTFFLVQDRVPSAAEENRVAEVDAETGMVLNDFSVGALGVDVNFGDLEISTFNGNLFIVSSARGSVAEITPDGALVREYPLPAGVPGLSGIGLDAKNGTGWVFGTNGTVWFLTGFPGCAADLSGDGELNNTDVNVFVSAFLAGDPAADLNFDGLLNNSDINLFVAAFLAGCD